MLNILNCCSILVLIVSVNVKQVSNSMVGVIDFLSSFCSSQYNLAACKDQQDNLGLVHSEDETWEELRLVTAIFLTRLYCLAQQSLKLNCETNVMRANYILNGKISESHFFVANLLQLLCICLRCQFAICFRLCSSAHHLSGREYKSRCLWISNTHDGCSKPLRFVFYIAAFQTNIVQVQLGIQKGG